MGKSARTRSTSKDGRMVSLLVIVIDIFFPASPGMRYSDSRGYVPPGIGVPHPGACGKKNVNHDDQKGNHATVLRRRTRTRRLPHPASQRAWQTTALSR